MDTPAYAVTFVFLCSDTGCSHLPMGMYQTTEENKYVTSAADKHTISAGYIDWNKLLGTYVLSFDLTKYHKKMDRWMNVF